MKKTKQNLKVILRPKDMYSSTLVLRQSVQSITNVECIRGDSGRVNQKFSIFKVFVMVMEKYVGIQST